MQLQCITKIFRLIFFMPLIVITLFIAGSTYADVSFSKLYGSDLGMGIGAKAIGMGGAFVSVADDPSAVFWNPAGLTELKGAQFYVSAETPEDFSTATIIYSPSVSFLKAFNTSFGISFINRLRFKGDSGSGTWKGAPSHVLDLSMVDVGENYSGKVDSTTRDIRLSAAFSPGFNKNLSFGMNYMFIE